jgi:hypothetical protein
MLPPKTKENLIYSNIKTQTINPKKEQGGRSEREWKKIREILSKILKYHLRKIG